MSRWVDDESTLEELPSGGPLAAAHDDLHIVFECDRPSAGSTRHDLAGIDEILMGRGKEREVQRTSSRGIRRLIIAVPDSHMSSSHARLRRMGGGWFFEDVGSRNGSYVLGRRVDRAPLGDGSIIELGHTYFLLRSRPLPKPQAAGPADIDAPTSAHPPLGTLNRDLEDLFAQMVTAFRTGVPVLLVGEAGSGKDSVARALHAAVQRPGEFVTVDCALLGREKGAPHGDHLQAELRKRLERAAGGTLFLSEIEQLSPVAELALLPILRSDPPGNAAALISSMRASPDLRPQVPPIRADLLAHLAGLTVSLPPLRNRREDFGTLLAQMLGRVSADPHGITMDPSMGQALLLHEWPYNISELESCIRTAVALSAGGCIKWSPSTLFPAGAPRVTEAPSEPPPAALPAEEEGELREASSDFVQNVRRALKCNLSVPGLQKNGLLQSYMVLEATRGSGAPNETVPALRSLFLSAIESMRHASPRGEKQSRVLELTFVKPTPTQQEAAERLAMAFGTYRRYVTSALVELTSVLWFNELSARARFVRSAEPPNAPQNIALRRFG